MRKLIESTLVSLDRVVEAPERWATFDAEATALSIEQLANYDAFVTPCYDVGEYLGTFLNGGDLLAAWGDNRNIVTNFLWPQGRRDPDVFFAKQSCAITSSPASARRTTSCT